MLDSGTNRRRLAPQNETEAIWLEKFAVNVADRFTRDLSRKLKCLPLGGDGIFACRVDGALYAVALIVHPFPEAVKLNHKSVSH
jgi:hypothetical protein